MSTAIIRITSENSTTEKLSPEQKKRLNECESVIRKGQMHFAQMAKAVVTIRDEKLYLATHKTLGSYFAQKWDMTPQDVTRYTNAGHVLNLLERHGFTDLPVNEGQARSLVDINTDERRLAVWDAVVKSGKKVTAKLIRSLATTKDHENWESFVAAAEAEVEVTTDQMPENRARMSTVTVTLFSDDDYTAIKECLAPWELASGTIHGQKDSSYLSVSVAPDQIPTLLKQLADKLSASMPNRLSLRIEL